MRKDPSLCPVHAGHIQRREVAGVIGHHGRLQPSNKCGNEEIGVVIMGAALCASRGPKLRGIGPHWAREIDPDESLGERFELKRLPRSLLGQETPSDLVVHDGAQVDLVVHPGCRGKARDNRRSPLKNVCDHIGVQDEARHGITRRVEAQGETGQTGGTPGTPPTMRGPSRLVSPSTGPETPEDADSLDEAAPRRARRTMFDDPFCSPA